MQKNDLFFSFSLGGHPPTFLSFDSHLKKGGKKQIQAAYVRGLKERNGNGDRDQYVMVRLVASTQGSFHSRLTWDSRLEAPALHCSNAHVCELCVPSTGDVHIVWEQRHHFWASADFLERPALFLGTNYSRTCPLFPCIGSDVVCPTGSATLRPHICAISGGPRRPPPQF